MASRAVRSPSHHGESDTVANTVGDLTLDLNGDGRTLQVYHATVLTGAAAQDQTPPTLTIISPTQGQVVAGVANLNRSATDSGSGVERSLAVGKARGSATVMIADR